MKIPNEIALIVAEDTNNGSSGCNRCAKKDLLSFRQEIGKPLARCPHHQLTKYKLEIPNGIALIVGEDTNNGSSGCNRCAKKDLLSFRQEIGKPLARCPHHQLTKYKLEIPNGIALIVGEDTNNGSSGCNRCAKKDLLSFRQEIGKPLARCPHHQLTKYKLEIPNGIALIVGEDTNNGSSGCNRCAKKDLLSFRQEIGKPLARCPHHQLTKYKLKIPNEIALIVGEDTNNGSSGCNRCAKKDLLSFRQEIGKPLARCPHHQLTKYKLEIPNGIALIVGEDTNNGSSGCNRCARNIMKKKFALLHYSS